jgi:hypothetical protein
MLRDFWTGGFTSPVGMAPLNGNVCSDSGSIYRVQSDVNGAVSCSCHAWIHPKLSKADKIAGKKVPRIEERWCKHLLQLRDGGLELKPDAVTVVVAAPRPVAPLSEVARPKRRYQ